MTTASRPHDALRAAYLRESRRGEVHCGRGLCTMAGACVGDARCALLTLAGAPGSTPESGGRGTQMEGAGGTRYARRRDWINAVREGVDRSRCILPWVGHGRPPASSCGWAGGHGQSRLFFCEWPRAAIGFTSWFDGRPWVVLGVPSLHVLAGWPCAAPRLRPTVRWWATGGGLPRFLLRRASTGGSSASSRGVAGGDEAVQRPSLCS